MTTSARANARLEPEVAEELAKLRRITGKSTTEIIVAALRDYFRTTKSGQRHSETLLARLERVGFVGCTEGAADLSTHYKRAFGDGIARKSSRARR